jgi:hypothetical protein
MVATHDPKVLEQVNRRVILLDQGRATSREKVLV